MFTFYTPANDTVAQLYNPTGVALDGKGNMYIADSRDFVIRKVNLTTNIMTIIAGNGTWGYNGDGGPATAASILKKGDFFNQNINTQNALYLQGNVTVDKIGNIYLADEGNRVIRKIDTFGIIHTIAGGAIGIPGSNCNGVPATSATLGGPTNVAVDSNLNIYIADMGLGVVRRVDTNGIIYTFAGNGSSGGGGDGGQATNASINIPMGLCVDKFNNLYIADMAGYIRKVNTSGIISTIGGLKNGFTDNGHAATATLLNQPIEVACDKSGNLYIDDYYLNNIRKVDTNGIITLIAGGNQIYYSSYVGDGLPATSGTLFYPYGMAADTVGNLIFCDYGNNRVRQVNDEGIITTVAGNGGFNGDDLQATSASICEPNGLIIDKFGNIYFSDVYTNVIRKIDTNGIITTIAGKGMEGYTGDKGPATNATFFWPFGLAIDDSENIYISEFYNGTIRKIENSTGIITTLAAGISNPTGIAVNKSGDLFVVEYNKGIILKKEKSTGIFHVFAGGGSVYGEGVPATDAQIGVFGMITVDTAGNLFLPDESHGTIRKVDAVTGIITTIAGNADSSTLDIPYKDGGLATATSLVEGVFGIALDDTGNIYFNNGETLCKVTISTGIIHQIAGKGNLGKLGNNGPASDALFYNPEGMGIDRHGNLIIADQGNRAIYKINLGTYDTASTNSGNGNTTKGLTLYPNPTNGNFVIAGLVDSNTNGHVVEVVVDDVLGRELYRTRGKATNNYLNIPVSLNQSVANGIYYCYIWGGDVNTTVKVRVMR